MARKYTYTDFKTKKVLYEETHPNWMSEDDVNHQFKLATGRDYRLEKAVIEREIRIVED